MTVNVLKKEYNKTLELIRRGSTYMDSPDISTEKKEQALPAFRRLIEKTCKIAAELDQLNVEYSDKELTDGFEIGGDEN